MACGSNRQGPALALRPLAARMRPRCLRSACSTPRLSRSDPAPLNSLCRVRSGSAGGGGDHGWREAPIFFTVYNRVDCPGRGGDSAADRVAGEDDDG